MHPRLNPSQSDKPVLNLHSTDELKAELTLVLVTYLDCLHVRRQSPIQVLKHLIVNSPTKVGHLVVGGLMLQ